ncbi:hypothetical protein ACFE04_020794 [Oxalis oulophora]
MVYCSTISNCNVETPSKEPPSDEVVVVTQNADKTLVSPVEETTETSHDTEEESFEAPATDSDDSSTPAASALWKKCNCLALDISAGRLQSIPYFHDLGNTIYTGKMSDKELIRAVRNSAAITL